VPYDDLVRIRFGDNAYMLTSAADVRHVLVTNSRGYIKTPRLTGRLGRERAGRGLLTSSGGEHRRQRLLMQPLFHQQVMQRFSHVIENRTRRAMDGWRVGQDLDVSREMSDLALSVLLGVLFGVDFVDEGGAMAAAIRIRRQYTEYVYHSPLPFREVLPTSTVRAHRRALATLDRVIHDAIASRRRTGQSTGDMVSLLMGARYADGSHMTDAQVRDEVLTLTSTGHETIGDALAWTWYLLARHPDIDERLAVELERVLCGRPPTAEDFADLQYTGCVLSESMRLYPPTWIYTRVPLADDRLPSGHDVKQGWTLYLCPYVMHRHPDYFPDPERFDPDRFSEDRQERPKLAYFPFGGGPHTCIGEVFARLQGVLVLAMIRQRLRFEPIAGARVVPEAGVTLYPKHGLRLRLRSRG
jgi:cytochrome P450